MCNASGFFKIKMSKKGFFYMLNKQSKLGSLGLKPNCRFDGSVGVSASLAAIMSPMRQLLAL